MTFNELNPIIQSWIDSDEFIDSLISVTHEFNLRSSAPLSEAIVSLILKTITPVEFKIKLMSSLPEGNRSDALVVKLVNLSLLPIRGPLMESGIDISMIAPLDEASAVPYDPSAAPVKPTEVKPTSPVSDSAPVSPTETSEPAIADNEPSPTTPLTPNFDANTEPLAAPPLNSSTTASASPPAGGPAPFVIHEEKPVPQASMNSHNESPIRPMFYSGEREVKGSAPVANIEFGKAEDSKKIDPANVVDLNDLPL
jgi:hypothetical protein